MTSAPSEHGRYDYSPIVGRPKVEWPGGARVALLVIVNVEHFRFDRPTSDLTYSGPSPDVDTFAQRDYGSRVGFWRLLRVLAGHGIRVTGALNADVCRFYPEIVGAGNDQAWEWIGHGGTNSESLSGLEEERERRSDRRVPVDDRGRHRSAAARLAQPARRRDLQHARPPRRGGPRLPPRLERGRAAVRDARPAWEPAEPPVHAGAQRHAGNPAQEPHRARVPRHDLRPVRRPGRRRGTRAHDLAPPVRLRPPIPRALGGTGARPRHGAPATSGRPPGPRSPTGIGATHRRRAEPTRYQTT